MKKVKSKRTAWMIAVILFPIMLMAQAPDSALAAKHEFSIQQALDYAKKNNVQVKNALLDMRIQEQTNRDFTSAAYPQVNGSFTLVDNVKTPVSLIPAEFFGGTPGTFEKFPFGIKYNATGGISLDQL